MTNKLRQGKFDSYTIVNNGLIETDLLTEHEKIVYIVIRKHLNQEKQIAFPGMATIAKEARICKSVVVKAIQGLEEKGLLIVERQTTKYNEKKTNIYRFNDFAELWKAKTVDELKKIATETPIPLTDDEIINKALQIDKKNRQKLYNQLAKEFDKEKELESAEPTKVTDETSTQTKFTKFTEANNTTNSPKSQVSERYTIEKIRTLFDYDIIVADRPLYQRKIDAVMNILHTTLNTTKPTIRIGGEDKPSEIVIGKLMKLTFNEIIYCADKYSEQTERINNPTAYMLTLLYKAKEQMELDLTNEVKHDMANWSSREDTDNSYKQMEKETRNEEYLIDRGMEQPAPGKGQRRELKDGDNDG